MANSRNDLGTNAISIQTSPTLIPESAASFVTVTSLVARLSLRYSPVVIDAVIDTAKRGIALTLGVSRRVLMNRLRKTSRSRASQNDNPDNSVNGTSTYEKWSALGIAALDHTFTLTEMLAISGLHYTSTAVRSGFKALEESVRILEGVIGSNDTSRAIASIVALVHRELSLDPDFVLAREGRKVVLAGLTKAIMTFAVVQQLTRRSHQSKRSVLWKNLTDNQARKTYSSYSSNPGHSSSGSCSNSVFAPDEYNAQEHDSAASLVDSDTDSGQSVYWDSPKLGTSVSSYQSTPSQEITPSPFIHLATQLHPTDHHHCLPAQHGPLSTLSPHATPSTQNPNALLSHPCSFPKGCFIDNIARFLCYAKAAYGESFLHLVDANRQPDVTSCHIQHQAFATHTGISVDDILLSSYTDRAVFSMQHPCIHELVHYVAVDHAACAIVLTFRGTVGLSDLLTDLACAYTDVTLAHAPKGTFKAHSGMFGAAQMFAHTESKVLCALKAGLMRYPTYGVVLCGHSLGGGVASLLSILWGVPDKSHGASTFVTSPASGLPEMRPIHCYAYGPPAVMSADLSAYCAQGLVTSVVHRDDFVSRLSLGVLQDFKNIAVTLQQEKDFSKHVIQRMMRCFSNRTPGNANNAETDTNEDDQWFQAVIKTMRADMSAQKLYPPGNVHLITIDHDHTENAHPYSAMLPQPHTASKCGVTISRCDDIQTHFSEIVFSRSMLTDHSPTEYKKAVQALRRSLREQVGDQTHVS